LLLEQLTNVLTYLLTYLLIASSPSVCPLVPRMSLRQK